jgi:RHH-type proline utilization regulon transcriptional repressor/proline dehydrogenase/delta 1-pyrroline-5-carboxylate dehydrogenase
MSTFQNEPALELRREVVREELEMALRRVDATLPLNVPLIINGGEGGGDTQTSIDPGSPDRVVGRVAAATDDDVQRAIAAAQAGFQAWRDVSVAERAATLNRAADELRSRRLELAALAVRECAKPWREADADVCEAIDFLTYYAEQAQFLEAGDQLRQVPGERNSLLYEPRGIVAVIAPWNFPFAIATGMTAAGLATGNSVILKPALQASTCALQVVQALHRAGVPGAALQLLTGGDEPGAALVASPEVHTIAFTGSCAVGLQIIRSAAEVAPGQRHVKRVVAEMGGKNCVIVDADADLDEAVPGIVESAFGFAGQKCSAASRVLVHEALYEQFRTRVSGAVETLLVDQAERFGVDVPPVIDSEAQQRITSYIRRGTSDGEVLAQQTEVPRTGHFIPPTVIGGLSPDSPLVTDEIFGPVLTVEPIDSIGTGCEIVADSQFGLTAGLFSRNSEVIHEVVRRLPVGNLYINRSTTGAMVGRQPFGGNRLSGTGAKAGGPTYLLHFVEPHVICENTMRQGLVV